MKILKHKNIVERILTQYPDSRDCDKKLCARFWHWETETKQITQPFLKAYFLGKYTNAESIMRCRRKLQENQPELRGKNYKIRQGKEQEETRTEMLNS